ncbi:MAG: DUF3168 domain-containing protein [Propylenella sp.]
MSEAARALQEAVFSTLAGDAELTTLLGGAKVYDGAPRNAEAPYVHLGEANARDWSTATEAGTEVTFAVVAWSREPGRSEALSIAARVEALLHDAALPVDGFRLVNLRHIATETARDGKPEGRRVVARFRARVEAE